MRKTKKRIAGQKCLDQIVGVQERIEELEEKKCRIPEREDCRDCTSKLIAKNRSTSQHQCADDLRDDLCRYVKRIEGRGRKMLACTHLSTLSSSVQQLAKNFPMFLLYF